MQQEFNLVPILFCLQRSDDAVIIIGFLQQLFTMSDGWKQSLHGYNNKDFEIYVG